MSTTIPHGKQATQRSDEENVRTALEIIQLAPESVVERMLLERSQGPSSVCRVPVFWGSHKRSIRLPARLHRSILRCRPELPEQPRLPRTYGVRSKRSSVCSPPEKSRRRSVQSRAIVAMRARVASAVSLPESNGRMRFCTRGSNWMSRSNECALGSPPCCNWRPSTTVLKVMLSSGWLCRQRTSMVPAQLTTLMIQNGSSQGLLVPGTPSGECASRWRPSYLGASATDAIRRARSHASQRVRAASRT